MTKSPSPSPVADTPPDRGGLSSFADQNLWRTLLEATSREELSVSWLALQVRLIPGVESGMVVLAPSEKGPFAPTAFWPESLVDPTTLKKVTERALNERKGIVVRNEGGGAAEGTLLIAYPVRVGGRPYGAVTLRIASPENDQLQRTMRLLQWGVVWLESWVLRQQVEQEVSARQGMVTTLELAAAALEEKRFLGAATAVATQLATRFACERVSIGFSRGKHVRVKALSHAAQFKHQMNLVRAIGLAMDEGVDQQETIVYPPPAAGANLVLRAHEELAELQSDGAICTIPFYGPDRIGYGAMTFERSVERPFTPDETLLMEGIVPVVAPILDEKRLNDRLLIFKAFESCKSLMERLTGPRNMAFKLAAATALILVLVLSFVSGTYRVSAKTSIEGSVQRAITAPVAGFVAEAPVRPGDRVRQGQLLCALDKRELSLQLVRWQSERDQYQRQHREAMATGNRANMRVLREQINRAEAQIGLLEDQLQHSQLLAPFDGYIVSGDLSQSLGSPVEKGAVLFEVAPLGNYRVKLKVDEHDISAIKVGQQGMLILNSLPDLDLPITVQKITPVSATEEGENLFVVEARINHESERLRPGMEGVGKIVIGKRKLIWVLAHDIIDWFRLWLWSWWP